jgi:hypothetical protein
VPVSRFRLCACFRRSAARIPSELQGQIRQCWVIFFLAIHGGRLSNGSLNKALLRRGCGGCLLPPSLAGRGGGGRRDGGSFPSPDRRPLAPLHPAPTHGVWLRSSLCSGEAPWWGVLAAGDVDGSSSNKCVAASISSGPLLLFLLLAGQGGEGRRKRSRGARGSDGWRGPSLTSASRRGASRSPLWCFDKLPRWKLFELLELETPLPIEHCPSPVW